MAVIILTGAISNNSGIDKSVIYTANLFNRNAIDVSICTFLSDATNGERFSTPKYFDLDYGVKVCSLLDNYIECDKIVEKKRKIVYEVNHKFLRNSFSEYEILSLKDILEKTDKDDTIICASAIALDLIEYAKATNIKAKCILQIHSDYEIDTDNKAHLLSNSNILDGIQIVSSSMEPYIKSITQSVDIFTIYNVINFQKKADLIQKIVSPYNRVSIIGSIQERKNQLDAIKIIQKLSESYILQIFGDPVGDYTKEIIEYIEVHNLSEKVKFMGYKSEEEIYSNSDVVIVTSKSEGFGYTLAESIFHGIPIVSYDYKYGASEIVCDGLNGYLVEMGNIDVFSEKIKSIVEGDYNSYRKNCLQKFDSSFTAEKVFENYAEKLNFGNTKNFFTKYPNTVIKNYEIKAEEKLFLNKNIYSSYTVEIPYHIKGNVEKMSLYCLSNRGKELINFCKKSNMLSFKNKGLGKNKGCLFLLEDLAGNQFYLFTLNWNGKIEKLDTYYNSNQVTGAFKINVYENNVTIANPTKGIPFEVVDEKENSLNHYTVNNNNDDGIFKTVLVIEDVRNDFSIHYRNGEVIKVELEKLNCMTFSDIWNKFEFIEKKYGLYSKKINGINIWEVIRPNLYVLIMKAYKLWKQPPEPKTYHVELKKTSKITDQEDLKGTLVANVGDNHELYFPFMNCETVIHSISEKSYYYYASKYGTNVALFKAVVSNVKIDNTEINRLAQLIESTFPVISNVIVAKEITSRINNFTSTEKMYDSFFKKNNISKVIVVSSAWMPGLISAAKKNNIKTAELQYALMAEKHLNYGLPKDREYCPDEIYVWNEFWRSKNLFATKQSLIPSNQNLKYNTYDCAIISQHLLSSHVIKFSKKLSTLHPDKKILVLLHPAEQINVRIFSEFENIDVAKNVTEEAIKHINVFFGMFSTTLYKVHEEGKRAIVFKSPGSEMIEDDIFEYVEYSNLEKLEF